MALSTILTLENPLLVLFLGIVFIIVSITVLRVHAFMALVAAAILVGILSPQIGLGEAADKAAAAFGRTAGNIGIVIGLAAITGKCLMDSGGADRITRAFLRVFGEKRASLALLGSGFILAIPIFFDVVFYLLVPLARAMAIRTGKGLVFLVMAICAGGAITHSLVPPTPGPLLMADNVNLAADDLKLELGLSVAAIRASGAAAHSLGPPSPGSMVVAHSLGAVADDLTTVADGLKVDLGMVIWVGTLIGIVPALIGGWWYARFVDRRVKVPLRDTMGSSLEDLRHLAAKPDSGLPPLWLSALPVLLPVALITLDTVVKQLGAGGSLLAVSGLVGNRNVALLLATVVALYLLAREKGYGLAKLRDTIGPAVESAGMIVLITCGGGAFGLMLKDAGVGEAIGEVSQAQGYWLLLLGFGIAAVMKIAQGSGTVSMITASAMVAPLVFAQASSLPFHPVYVIMAIGSGSLAVSWMNDSGFWVVCQMSGFTVGETLKTWTILLVVMAFIGFLTTLAASLVFPMV